MIVKYLLISFFTIVSFMLSATPLMAEQKAQESTAEHPTPKSSVASLPFSRQVKELNWEDLVPDITFEDPFEALSHDQLGMLALVARIRQETAAGNSLGDESLQEAVQLERELAADGVDVDLLLSRREEVRQLRELRATTAPSELVGVEIRITGHVLPLKFNKSMVTEFLLVPRIGACIHEPPPPPNQVVHVVLDEQEAFKPKGRFEQTRVSGLMTIKHDKVGLFHTDGSDDIYMIYRLQKGHIETTVKQTEIDKEVGHELKDS